MSLLLEIPVENDGDAPVIEISTSLDGRRYVLRVRWSERATAWYLDLETEDAQPIVQGRLVRLNRNLISGAVHPDAPAGVIAALRVGESVELPSLEGLGETVRLYYYVQ